MMNTYIYSARLQRRRRRRRRRRRSNARVRRGYIKLLFVHMKNTRIARLLRFFKVNQLSSLKKIFSLLSREKRTKISTKTLPKRAFLPLSLSLRVLYFHTATRDRCCCSSYRSKEEEKEDARQKKRDGERKEGGR